MELTVEKQKNWALLLAQQLIELFKYCGMPVHKFFSNSKLVCETLDKNYLAKHDSAFLDQVKVKKEIRKNFKNLKLKLEFKINVERHLQKIELFTKQSFMILGSWSLSKSFNQIHLVNCLIFML